MKKLLAFLLATLMLCSLCLAACSKQDGDETRETAAATTTGANEEGIIVDEKGFEVDDLPDMDFEGKVIRVLMWTQPLVTEFYTQTSASVMENSLWERQMNIAARFGCGWDIKQMAGTGGSSDNEEWFAALDASMSSEGDGYDLICQYSSYGMVSALNGHYYDLMEYDYINPDKPWWPSDLMDCLNFGGSVYFVSGDIAAGRTTALYACLVNNDMLVDYQLEEDPYTLAMNGTWTFEKMKTLTAGIYTDLNESGSKDKADEYGLSFCTVVGFDAMLEGSGIRFVDKDAEGVLSVSKQFAGVKTANLIDAMANLVAAPSTYVNPTSEYNHNWREGRSMFGITKIDELAKHATNPEANFSFGVLPIPKYDENQETYRSCVNFNYSMFSVPKTAFDAAKMTLIIEALGSEGYRTVMPAIFETCFKLQYSEDPTISKMFDLIRDGTSFDIGRLTYKAFEANGLTAMPEAFRIIAQNGIGWGATIKRSGEAWKNLLDEISETLAELD